MAVAVKPKVFVSYAHDSEAHKSDVREFAEVLADSGVDVTLDQWENRRLDWSAWAIDGMTAADYVVAVASPRYRAEGDGVLLRGSGVRSETAVLRDLLHHDPARWLPRLLPVLLPGHEVEEIPYFLQPHVADHYKVTGLTRGGVEDLLRVITGQPAWIRPAIGEVPVLPPRSDRTRPWPAPVVAPPAVVWRSGLVGDRVDAPTLEVHLTPVDGHRIQARALPPLAAELAALGRAHRLFDVAERVAAEFSDEGAWAVGEDRSGCGLAVLRSGQRTAWSRLPSSRFGALLIPDDLVERLTAAIRVLLTPDLPAPARLAPAVGVEPLGVIRIGRREDLTATTGPVHVCYRPHLRVPAEEAFTPEHLRQVADEVADELTTRLLGAFRREVR
ncbi:SEFIR domain-containing protein [Actinosynnema sp. NPDC020468]|uniref:SEFIR domain-containing protein n=1 Tax=Actinosynnema sp. NPDC020468 TaxID=3154488 RepID=UPI003411B0FC